MDEFITFIFNFIFLYIFFLNILGIRFRTPYFILNISIIQVLLYTGFPHFNLLDLCLMYDPFRRHELWRYITNMFVHSSLGHVLSNTIVQIWFALPLENMYGSTPTAIIYLAGVLGGTLAGSLVQPKMYSLGASHGGYAMFSYWIAVMFFESDSALSLLDVFGISLQVVRVWLECQMTTENQNPGPPISHAAHYGGAFTGFAVAVLTLPSFSQRLKNICGVLLVIAFFITVQVNANHFPKYYCKAQYDINYAETANNFNNYC